MTALTSRPFEDISVDHDWPKDLRALHRAANEAWSLYSNLEDALKTPMPLNARGSLHILAGEAFTMLNNLRGAGVTRLWQVDRQRQEAQAAAEQQQHNEEGTGGVTPV